MSVPIFPSEFYLADGTTTQLQEGDVVLMKTMGKEGDDVEFTFFRGSYPMRFSIPQGLGVRLFIPSQYWTSFLVFFYNFSGLGFIACKNNLLPGRVIMHLLNLSKKTSKTDPKQASKDFQQSLIKAVKSVLAHENEHGV